MQFKTSNGAVYKEYFRYLMPTIIGQVAHCCYCLADVYFVGKAAGSVGLAALNIALPIFTIYTTFSIMIGVGTATTISICRGEGDFDKCDRLFSMSLWLVGGIGILLSVLFTIFLRPIAYLFGATDLIVQGVVDYLLPIAPLAFIYMLSSMLSVVVRSDGNPRLVMVAATTGNLANIVLDYVFVMPLGMGVFGAGLATIIGPCISCGLLSLHFVRRMSHLQFVKKCFDFRLLWRMLRNGVGAGVLEVSAGFVILMFNRAIIREGGEVAVAIFSLISNIGYVGKGIFNGMAQAAQPIIGLSYGRQDYTAMRAVNRCARLTALCFSLVIYGVIVLFPEQIMAAFMPLDDEIIAMGTTAIMIYFISLPFAGMNTVMMYYFQSIEAAGYTLSIAISRGIVLVYAALTVCAALWGLSGIWIALAAAEALTFVIFYPMRIRMDRKRFMA